MSKARCKNCGDIIESKHRHDWVCCSCFRNNGIGRKTTGIFIDGGNEYNRCGGNMENIEWIEMKGQK